MCVCVCVCTTCFILDDMVMCLFSMLCSQIEPTPTSVRGCAKVLCLYGQSLCVGVACANDFILAWYG
jgi:hypothetical protein